MIFKRLCLFSVFLLLVVFYSCVNQSYAQVGNRPACTNYTCRQGECEQLETNFLCHCIPGVKGTNCDLRMQAADSLCASAPCWSGGTCIDRGNDYECRCVPGRTGKNCRTIDSAPCLQNNPCRNNAVCRTQSDSAGVFCFCVGDWTGRFCDTRIQLCDTANPCYNGGVCRNNRCECPANFSGQFCQTINKVNTDQVVKVKNKGGYVAYLKMDYELTDQATGRKRPIQQTGRIPLNYDYAFYIPRAVVLDGEFGAVLTVTTGTGRRVLREKIRRSPECIHVWGTVTGPKWTYVNCW